MKKLPSLHHRLTRQIPPFVIRSLCVDMAVVVVSDLLDIGEADAVNVVGIILTSCDGAGAGFFSKIDSFCLIVKEKV